MALKKNEDFDFKDDQFLTDGDDFSFDDLEDMDTDGPVKKAGRMVFSSMKAMSSGALKGAMGALEATVGYDASSTIEDTIDFVKEAAGTVGEVVGEGKKAYQGLKRVGLNMLPMTKKLMPDRLYKWSEEFLKKDLPMLEDTQSDEARQEKEMEEHISSTITDVFKATEKYQRERFIQESNDRQVDRMTKISMHKQEMSGLASIDRRAAEISSFLRGTYTSYLKKDLELKYRSYFIARDTLKYVKAMSSVFEQKLEAIKINSGLPDVIKAESNEELNRRKGKSSGGFGKWQYGVKDQIISNIKDTIVGPLKSFNTDMLPMLTDMSSTMADMGGMVAYSKQDAVNSGLGAAARFGTQLLLGKLIDNKYFDIAKLMRGDFSNLKSGLKSKLLNYKDTHTGFLADLIPDFQRNKESENKASTKPLDPATFDNLTRESIISVIPAHLERIGDSVEAAIAHMGITVDEKMQKTYNLQKRSLISVAEQRRAVEEMKYGTEEERAARSRGNRDVFKANILSKYGINSEATDADIAKNAEASAELKQLEEMMPLLDRFFSTTGESGRSINIRALQKFLKGDIGDNEKYLENTLGGTGDDERKLAEFLIKNMTRNGYLDLEQQRAIERRMADHRATFDAIEDRQDYLANTGMTRFARDINYDKMGRGFISKASNIMSYADRGKEGDIVRFDPETGEKTIISTREQKDLENSYMRARVGDMNESHQIADRLKQESIQKIKDLKLDEEFGLKPEEILEAAEQMTGFQSVVVLPAQVLRLAANAIYLGLKGEDKKKAMRADYEGVEREEGGDSSSFFSSITGKVDKAAGDVFNTINKIAGKYEISSVTQMSGNTFAIYGVNPKNGDSKYQTFRTKKQYTRDKYGITDKPDKKYITTIINDILKNSKGNSIFMLDNKKDVTEDGFFRIDSEAIVESTMGEKAKAANEDAMGRAHTWGATASAGPSKGPAENRGPINQIADDVRSILNIMKGKPDGGEPETPPSPTEPVSPITPIGPSAGGGETPEPVEVEVMPENYKWPGHGTSLSRIEQMQDLEDRADGLVQGLSLYESKLNRLLGPAENRGPMLLPQHEEVDLHPAPIQQPFITIDADDLRRRMRRPKLLPSGDDDTDEPEIIDVTDTATFGEDKKKSFFSSIKDTMSKAFSNVFGSFKDAFKGTGSTKSGEVSGGGNQKDLSLLEFEGDPESLFHKDFRLFANRLLNKLETMDGFGGGGILSGLGSMAKNGLSAVGSALGTVAKGTKNLLFGNSETGSRGLFGTGKDLLFGSPEGKGLIPGLFGAGKNLIFGNEQEGKKGLLKHGKEFLFGNEQGDKQGLFGKVGSAVSSAASATKGFLFGKEVQDYGENALVPPGSTYHDGAWYDKDGNMIPGIGTKHEGGILTKAGTALAAAGKAGKNFLLGDETKGTRGALGTAKDLVFGDSATGKKGLYGHGKDFLFGDKEKGTRGALGATKDLIFGNEETGKKGLYGRAKDAFADLKDKIHMPKSFADLKATIMGGTDSEGKNHEGVYRKVKNAVKKFFGMDDGPKYIDIYLKGRIEPGNPLLKATDQEAGVFFVDGSGRVERSKDINKPVCNGKEGDDYRVLIKEDDLKVGLVDADGKSIYDAKQSLFKRILSGARRLVTGVGTAIGEGFSKLFGLDKKKEGEGSAPEEMTYLGKKLGFTPNGPFQDKVIAYLDAIATKMGCEVKIAKSGEVTAVKTEPEAEKKEEADGKKPDATPEEKKSIWERGKTAVTGALTRAKDAVTGLFNRGKNKPEDKPTDRKIGKLDYTEEELTEQFGIYKVGDGEWFDPNRGEIITADQLPKKQSKLSVAMTGTGNALSRIGKSISGAMSSAKGAVSSAVGKKTDAASDALLRSAGFVPGDPGMWLDTSEESTGEPIPAADAIKMAAKRKGKQALSAVGSSISSAFKSVKDKTIDAVMFPGRVLAAAGRGTMRGISEGASEVATFWKNKLAERKGKKSNTPLNVNLEQAKDNNYFTDPDAMEADAASVIEPKNKTFMDKVKSFFSRKKEEPQLTPFEQRMLALTEAGNQALMATQKATEKTAEETEKLNEEPDKNGTLDEEGSAADQKRDVEEANKARHERLRKLDRAGDKAQSDLEKKVDNMKFGQGLTNKIADRVGGWMDAIKKKIVDFASDWGGKGLRWGKDLAGKGFTKLVGKIGGEAATKALAGGGGKGLAVHAMRKMGMRGAAKVLSKQGGKALLKHGAKSLMTSGGATVAGGALLGGGLGLLGSKSSGAGKASQAFSTAAGATAGGVGAASLAGLAGANAWNPVGWAALAALAGNAMREGWNDKKTLAKSWDGRNADNAHDYQKGASAVGNIANYATFGLLNKLGGRKYVDKAISNTNLGHIVGGIGGQIAGTWDNMKLIGRAVKGEDAAMTEDEIRKARAKLKADVKRGYPNAAKNLKDFEDAVKNKKWAIARNASGVHFSAGKEYLKNTKRFMKGTMAVATAGLSSMAEMGFHKLFGDNTKPMDEKELKAARAKIAKALKKNKPGAKALSINFEEAVEGENWATARKLVRMEDKGFLTKMYGSRGKAALAMATGGLSALFTTDQDKPLSEKEIKGFRDRCDKAIKAGSKESQKILDKFNEAVEEQNWKLARKLSNMKDTSIISKVGSAVGTALKYVTPAWMFMSDDDKPMSEKEIDDFRKKMEYLKSQGDTMAGPKLEKFEVAMIKQEWALARKIANTPHKSIVSKVGSAILRWNFGDDDQAMTEAEIKKFQDSMTRKIDLGDTNAKRRLDEFNDAVGRQNWRKARAISDTKTDGIWAKMGKGMAAVDKTVFGWFFGGNNDSAMSDEEITKFKERMQALIDQGDIVAKQKLKQFEDAVLDQNWKKARAIAQVEHRSIFGKVGHAIADLFNSKVKVDEDEKNTDESKLAQRYRLILSRVLEAMNKPKIGFFSRHRLASLRNEMKDADLTELNDETLDEWADRLKDIDKSAGDLSAESVDEYEKERKAKSKLLTQQQNLLKEIVASQERCGVFQFSKRSQLKKLFNEVEAIPLEELDKDILDSYDEDLRSLDPKAMSTKELSKEERAKVSKLLKRQQTLLGNIDKAKSELGVFSLLKRSRLGRLQNEVLSTPIEELEDDDFDSWDEELKDIDPKAGSSKQHTPEELKKMKELVRKKNKLLSIIDDSRIKSKWYQFDRKSTLGKLTKEIDGTSDEELTEDMLQDWEETLHDVDKDAKSIEESELEDKNHKQLLRDKRQLKIAIKKCIRRHRKDKVGFFGTDISKGLQKLVNKLDSIDDDEFTTEQYDDIKEDFAELDKEAAASVNRSAKSDKELKEEAKKKEAEKKRQAAAPTLSAVPKGKFDKLSEANKRAAQQGAILSMAKGGAIPAKSAITGPVATQQVAPGVGAKVAAPKMEATVDGGKRFVMNGIEYAISKNGKVSTNAVQTGADGSKRMNVNGVDIRIDKDGKRHTSAVKENADGSKSVMLNGQERRIQPKGRPGGVRTQVISRAQGNLRGGTLVPESGETLEAYNKRLEALGKSPFHKKNKIKSIFTKEGRESYIGACKLRAAMTGTPYDENNDPVLAQVDQMAKEQPAATSSVTPQGEAAGTEKKSSLFSKFVKGAKIGARYAAAGAIGGPAGLAAMGTVDAARALAKPAKSLWGKGVSTIGDWFKSGKDKVTGAVTNAKDAVTGAYDTAKGKVLAGVGAVASMPGKAKDYVVGKYNDAKDAIMNKLTAGKQFLEDKYQQGKDWAMGKLTGAKDKLKGWWDAAKGKAMGAFAKIKKALGPAGSTLEERQQNPQLAMANDVNLIYNILKDKFGAPKTLLGKVASNAASVAVGAGKLAWKGLKAVGKFGAKVIGKLRDAITGGDTQKPSTLEEIKKNPMQAIANDVSLILKHLTGGKVQGAPPEEGLISKGWTALKGLAGTAINKAKGVYDNATTALGDRLYSAYDKAKKLPGKAMKAYDNATTALGDKIYNAAVGAKDAYNNATTVLGDKIYDTAVKAKAAYNNATTALGDKIYDTTVKAKTAYNDATTALGDKLYGAAEGTKQAVRSASNKASGWFGKAENWFAKNASTDRGKILNAVNDIGATAFGKLRAETQDPSIRKEREAYVERIMNMPATKARELVGNQEYEELLKEYEHMKLKGDRSLWAKMTGKKVGVDEVMSASRKLEVDNNKHEFTSDTKSGLQFSGIDRRGVKDTGAMSGLNDKIYKSVRTTMKGDDDIDTDFVNKDEADAIGKFQATNGEYDIRADKTTGADLVGAIKKGTAEKPVTVKRRLFSSLYDSSMSLINSQNEKAISLRPDGSVRGVTLGGKFSVAPDMHRGDDMVHVHPDRSPTSITDILSSKKAGLNSISTVRPKFSAEVVGRLSSGSHSKDIISPDQRIIVRPDAVKRKDIGEAILETVDLNKVETPNSSVDSDKLNSWFGDLIQSTKDVGSKLGGVGNASANNGDLLQAIYDRLGVVIKAIGVHNEEIDKNLGTVASESFRLMKQYTNNNFQTKDTSQDKPLDKGPSISVRK